MPRSSSVRGGDAGVANRLRLGRVARRNAFRRAGVSNPGDVAMRYGGWSSSWSAAGDAAEVAEDAGAVGGAVEHGDEADEAR